MASKKRTQVGGVLRRGEFLKSPFKSGFPRPAHGRKTATNHTGPIPWRRIWLGLTLPVVEGKP